MADPTGYDRDYSFSGFQANAPATPLPGQQVDIQLDKVSASITTIVNAIRDVRRPDGKLRNGIVTAESLSPDLVLGFRPPAEWRAGVEYKAGDTVFADVGFYRALVDHVSTNFAANLAAGLWELFADMSQVIANVYDILANFVQGMTLSNNAGDPNNKIDIAPGRARGNGVTVVNPATLTVALGAGAAPNTTYHIHALRHNVTGNFWVAADVSPTSPDVPPGYTRVQRLGAILTDGSGNIRPFVQNGNKFMHNVLGGVLDYSGTSVRALSPLTVTVPNGVRVEGIFGCSIIADNGDAGVSIEVRDGSNQNVRKQLTNYVNTGVNQIVTTIEQFTNTTRQVGVAVNGAPHPSLTCNMSTLGWIDYQIPRIGA